MGAPRGPPRGPKNPPRGPRGTPKTPKRPPRAVHVLARSNLTPFRTLKSASNTVFYDTKRMSAKTPLGGRAGWHWQSAQQEGSARLVRGRLPRAPGRSVAERLELIPSPFGLSWGLQKAFLMLFGSLFGAINAFLQLKVASQTHLNNFVL